MKLVNTNIGRRAFIRNTGIAGGGLILGFGWLNSCKPKEAAEVAALEMPEEWFEINGYLKIGDNGVATIMSPNPEIGQNVKTSMPMIVADELDMDWDKVLVEQAALNTDVFTWQVAGGSMSILNGWEPLRKAGATARQMLKQAAAQQWQVPVEEITTSEGMLYHEASGKSAHYGEVASAAARLEVPEEVPFKERSEYTIIGTSRKNVDGKNIVTGKPLYGLDVQREGMLIAGIVHPPAFNMKLKSVDNMESVKSMPGIRDVFTIDLYDDDYQRSAFHHTAFNELVVVLGETTWQVFQAKKALQTEWEASPDKSVPIMDFFGNNITVNHPAGAENSAGQRKKMEELNAKPGKVVRKDGDPEAAFKNAARVIERTYSCPFLAHNTMEPMNFFAHVTEDHAELLGPTQTPEWMEPAVAKVTGLPLEKIDIMMTRQGGGFGRRLYGHFLVEAAAISKRAGAPVKLVYTREDDMSQGTYRPAYLATYRAALDKDNNLIAFHVRAGGIPESPLFANRFPAGAIDNYLAEDWTIESNVTTGAFRAPRSNFIAGAEQAFLDEIAEAAGKDPIEFRLDLLKRAQEDPVGENNDYEADRYAGVLELVREKSGWGQDAPGKFRGVSAYFCHNSYVAQVLDVVMEDNNPKVDRVCVAVDCGIVINPDAATNLAEGGSVDGIGHAMYSAMTFEDGKPQQTNFDRYRLIRHSEAPKSIDVHFVDNGKNPTGMGEPPFPPVMGALANAMYKATGRRVYNQPFINDRPPLVG